VSLRFVFTPPAEEAAGRGAAGRDVGTTAAARSYFKRILPEAPEPMETTTIAAAPNGAPAQPLEAEISSE
jgi:hypothetical protein